MSESRKSEVGQITNKLLLLRRGGGADAVDFKTYLYVGAAALIIEFQGSPLVLR